MDKMPDHRREELKDAFGEVIALTNDGMEPNEAMQKIASKYEMGPGEIQAGVGAINKARSVASMSAASDDKTGEIPLADAQTVVRGLMGENAIQKTASKAFHIPGNIELTPRREKEASVSSEDIFAKEVSELPSLELYNWEKEASASEDIIREELRHDMLRHYKFLGVNMEKMAGVVERMTGRERQMFADIIVSNHGVCGENLLKCAGYEGDINEISQGVPMPNTGAYDLANGLIKLGSATVARESGFKKFEKEALNFLTGFTQDVLANLSADSLTDKSKKAATPRTLIDAGTINRRKALATRKAFMGLSRDPRIAPFVDSDDKTDKFLEAFNETISENPELLLSPGRLRDKMIHTMEGPGSRDAFELEQDAKLAETLKKGTAAKLDERKRKDEIVSSSLELPTITPTEKKEDMTSKLMQDPFSVIKWANDKLKKEEDSGKEVAKSSQNLKEDMTAYRDELDAKIAQLKKERGIA